MRKKASTTKVTKSISKPIKLVYLSTGYAIIGTVISETKTDIRMQNVMLVREVEFGGSSAGIVLLPFTPFCSSQDITINKIQVIYTDFIKPVMKSYYLMSIEYDRMYYIPVIEQAIQTANEQLELTMKEILSQKKGTSIPKPKLEEKDLSELFIHLGTDSKN